jgi:hypothetical protein
MWNYESDWDKGTATVFEPSSPRLSKKRLGEELDKLYTDAVLLGQRIAVINDQVIGFLAICERFQKQQAERPALPADPLAIRRQIIPKALLKGGRSRRDHFRCDLNVLLAHLAPALLSL